MRFRDMMKLFHGQRLSCCLLVFYLVLTMLLGNLLFQTQQHFEDEQMHYASLWDGKQVYATYDTLYEHKGLESAYLTEPGSQQRVQRYINVLEEDERFPYYICGTHDLMMNMENIPASCKVSQDNSQVYAHQVNANVMRDFSPKMLTGKTFSGDDYLWSLGDEVPVILGYDWRNTLQVGDRFEATLMTVDMTFRVIGVAEENTYFPLFDDLTYEDNVIILPTLRCIDPPLLEDEDFLQKVMALQNASGYFRLDKNQSLSDLVSFLETTSQQLGMFETKLMRIDQARLLMLAVSSDKHKQIYLGLMLTLGFCSLISMMTLSQAVVRKNERMLSIYYLAGAKPWQISFLVMGQGLLMDVVAAILSAGVTALLLPSIPSIHIPMQLVMGICMCLCSIPALHTFFLHPIDYLKKE